MGARVRRGAPLRSAAAALALALLGVVGPPGDVSAAVTLTSTCPIVGVGSLVAGDPASGSATTTTLSNPAGLAIDQADGTMYVSESNWDTGTYTSSGRGQIRRITPSGSISDLPPGPPGVRLGRLALNPGGSTLFVATQDSTGVYRVYGVDLTLATPTWAVVAGGGSDYLGNGVPATSARFFQLDDVEVSPTTGLLYVSGTTQDATPPAANVGVVREIDGAGNIRTVVGGVRSTAASRAESIAANSAFVQFSPVLLAFDSAGVMNLGTLNRVRRIPPAATADPYGDGIITTFSGANGTEDVTGDGGTAVAARLGQVSGLALDQADNLYIGGEENHTVRRIDPAGTVVSTIVSESGSLVSDAGIAGFSDGAGDVARMAYTQEMATYGGDLYVVDSRNNRVRRVTPGVTAALTSVTTVAGRGPNLVDETGPAMTRRTGLPDGTAVGPDGSVYFADRAAYRVWRRDPDGTLTSVAGNGAYRGLQGVLASGPAVATSLSIVRDVAISTDNTTLYILERTRILAVDLATGTLTLLAGTGTIGQTDNAVGALATLDAGPSGTLAIGGGSLFASGSSGNVRRVSLATGAVDTPITGLGTGANVLSLDADAGGNLFLGVNTHQILYWSGSGAPTPIAGDAVSGNTGDGGPAAVARIGSPRGLTLLDRPGNDDVLYFANQLRQIRSISAGPGAGAARWAGGMIDLVAGNASGNSLAPGDWGDGRDLSANRGLTRFNSIRDMDIDPQGRLVVVDSNFDADPGSYSATNTGPHQVRVLTDTGCAEAGLGGPGTVGTATSTGVDLATLPLGQIPFDSAAIAATPMRAVPMRASELDATPMRASPMRAVPMRAVPMRASGLGSSPMRASSLSSFPLDQQKFPGGWPERLAGTPYADVLPQNVRFSDLLDDPSTPVDETSPALDKAPQITLADIDLSTSPMRAVSIASIALGSTPMRAVPMRASLIGATDAQRFQAWCDLLTDPSVPEISQLGYTCASLGLTPDSPLLALDVASVPMRAVPMRAVPMRAVDISSSPMRAVPMRASGIAISGVANDADVRSSPMRAVPMRAVAEASAPMRAVPLNAIPMRAVDARPSPMRAVELSLLGAGAANVATCYPSCATLGEAADLNAIPPTATLGDLIPALNAILSTTGAVPKLGDLRFGDAPLAGVDKDGDHVITDADEINLGDIIPFLPEDPFISLADVLVGFIAAQDLPWEDVNFESMGINSLAGAGDTASLPFSFRVYPGQASTVPVTVSLPAGWRYSATDPLDVTPDAGSSSSQPAPVPTVALDPVTSVQSLTYAVPAGSAAPGTVQLSMTAFPGNKLGTFQAQATIGAVISNGASRTVQSSPISVVDPSEFANYDYDHASIVQPNKLYLGHLNAADDSDYYRVSASGAGAITRINLSHLPVDADLVVYEEDPSNFDFRAGVGKLRQQSKPVEMADPSVRAVGDPLEPQELQDIPTEPGKKVASISARRGTASESVELINDKPGVDYVIAVRGYNGASSADPYAVRVQQYTPPGALACDQSQIRLPALPGGYTTSAPISGVSAGTQTLILANRERLTRAYGATAADSLLANLDTFAGDPSVGGAVVLVDGDPAVRSAYDNWDASPCGLGLPNLVVRKINDYVDALLGPSGSPTRATVANVVVVGSDEQVPMARLIDNTKLSNELEYGAELRRPNPVPNQDPISTPQTVAMASRSLLTDDPYASLAPKLFGADVVYPPDLTIGRLVETPTEIEGALAQYGASSGRLSPDSALVTGYDFLSDGASGVRTALAPAVPSDSARDGSLISNTWTAGELSAKLLPPADPPDIGSINAHFDHHRLLPAEGDTNPAAPVFTTQDPGFTSDKLAGKVLFSMGCHSGTGAPDYYLGSSGGNALDWPQLFAEQKAIWVANSGFGYGDTATVAYSERLMTLFASRLGGGTPAGEALRLAKQDYLGGGISNSYDAKAMSQIIYYGLPMFRVGSGTPVTPAPTYVPTAPDPSAANLASHSVTVAPDLRLSDPQSDGSRYVYTNDAAETVPALRRKTQVVDGRPIQPRVDVDVTAAGLEARGAVITGMTMVDQPLTVTVGRPVVDKTANEPPIPATEMVYPSAFQNVTTFEDASGLRNKLVLIPGQWLPDSNAATKPNVGIQRSFTSMTSTVYYAPPNDGDDTQPTIAATSGTASSGGVTFQAAISDSSASGPGTIARVSVLYLDGTTWRSTELTQTAPGQFVGGGPAAATAVDYLVQAVDGSGNVAVSSNKARLFTSTAAPVAGPGVNGAPTVTGPATGTGTVYQGVVFSGSFADADASTSWTGTVNNGAGDTRPIVITGSGFVATLPPYSTVGSYAATVSICDEQGGCGVAVVPVAIAGSGVVPTADCTVLSFGRAITWWGTQSSQTSEVTLPAGDANRFDQAPGNRGQPTLIEPGTTARRFATESPGSDRLKWSLGGTSEEALVARGCAG